MNDIDNSKLEEVMQIYAQEPGNDNLIKLCLALKDAQLFVPAMAVPKKGGFQPYVIKNQEGDMYMPAFTSQKKFPTDQKYQGMLKLQYKQCVSMLLDNATLVQGIALNPFMDNLMLKTQMLELSRKIEKHAQENQPKAVTIKVDDFRMVSRNNVEFHQIPQKLFEQKLEFIQSLSEEVFCEMYKVPYVEVGHEQHYPFTKDDFEILELNVREDLNIMQVVAPSKFLYMTNCRELYIVWNPQTEKIGYYVIEKGTDPNKNQFFLVRVTEEEKREQLEEAPLEGNVMNRVMELFEQDQNPA